MSTNAAFLSRLMLVERLPLLRLVRRIVGNGAAAEDVTQSLWFRVQGVEDEPPIVNHRAYLYRLATNLATDHARTARRQAALFDTGNLPEDVAAPIASAETAMIDRERLKRLEAAISELPPRCREVFILRRIEGLSPDVVAARLGITLNAVAKQVRIAVRHCHARLGDDSDA